MRRCFALATALLTLALAPPCVAREEPRDDQIVKNAREDRSAARVLLAYLPNRLFDVLDFLRLRARVGPGIAVRARATEQIDAGIGSYASIFAGLPGPRGEVEVPLPIGLETYSGVELVGDAEVSGGYSPNYTPTEIGVSIHAAAVGIDLGVDPIEVVDFVVGFVLLDLRGDDF